MTRLAPTLAIGLWLSGCVAAQEPARVQHVAVMGSGAALNVEIQTTGEITPLSQMLTGPDRIVVDFPGALPAAELRNLNVNRGALKVVRAGLFSKNPPVTRVVLDLQAPQSYQVFATPRAVMLKLTPLTSPNGSVETAAVSSTNDARPAAAPRPRLEVTFQNGLLRIRSEHTNLAQVLNEVQRQTGAEIAIPAGAESEEMAADLGPAPAREVLAALLNGSRYNFIFVGNDQGHTLQKAILSVR